jgi:hypothetical protein
LFIALISPGIAFAQTWNAPEPEGSAITGGTACYVYNVGAKQFLDRGGEWSTQAIVSTGALITPVQSSTLWILQYNSATQTLFADNVADGWTFTDNNKVNQNTWDIQPIDIVKNIYSIQINSAYAGYNAAQYLGAAATVFNSNRGLVYDVRYNRVASDYTKWKFCTAAAYEKFNAQVKLDKLMKIAKLVGSSVDLTSYITTYNTGTAAEIITATANLNTALAPTDKTSSITNPNFNTNAAGWTASPAPGWGSNEIEYWQGTFDLNQTVTGLPAGIYVVKVQGFERPVDRTSASRTAYLNGWDGLNSKFYATASGTKIFQPLKNYFVETTCPAGVSVDGYLYPDNMAQAQTAFAAGLYDNELSYVVVDATGSITLGVSNVYDNNKAGRWIIMDNFRLYYYGALAIPNLTVPQTSLFISDVVGTTKTFDVTGANLTTGINITAPAGITLSGTNLVDNGGGNYSIALANSGTLNTITATWDQVANLRGLITIQTAGVTTKEISITASKDLDCFTPVGTTNLIPNPYLNDLTPFGGWGHKSVVYGAEAYCGVAAVKFEAITNTWPDGAALDVNGIAWQPNSVYRVRAMVKSVDGTFAFYAKGTNPDVTISIPQSNNEWTLIDQTFTTGAAPTTNFFSFNNVDGASTGKTAYIDNWELFYVSPATSVPSIRTNSKLNAFVQNGRIVANFEADAYGVVELRVYNVQGVELTKVNASVAKGQNQYTFNSELPSGVYVIRMTENNISTAVKVVK